MQAMSKLAILLCSYTHQVGDKDKCNIQQLHIHQDGDKEDKCNIQQLHIHQVGDKEDKCNIQQLHIHQIGDKEDKCNIQQLHIHQIGDKEDKCNKADDAGKAPTKNAKGGIACKGAQVGEGRSGLVAVCQPDQTNVVCCELGDTARTHTHTHTSKH